MGETAKQAMWEVVQTPQQCASVSVLSIIQVDARPARLDRLSFLFGSIQFIVVPVSGRLSQVLCVGETLARPESKAGPQMPSLLLLTGDWAT